MLLAIFGFISIFAAGLFVYIGEVWAHGAWVYRAKGPKLFWFELSLYLLCGVGFFVVSFVIPESPPTRNPAH
jgi:hypothetical protein